MHHFAVIASYVELQQTMGIRPKPFRDSSLQGDSFLVFECGRSVMCHQRNAKGHNDDGQNHCRDCRLSHWHCLRLRSKVPRIHRTSPGCTERIIARLSLILTAHRVPAAGRLFAAALAGLFKLFEKARGAGTLERAHNVALAFFFAELDAVTLSLEFSGFLLFAAEPAGIVLSGVHVDT